MAVLLANEPILRTMQSAVREILGLQLSPSRKRLLSNDCDTEYVYIQLAAAGDLLLDALRLEKELSKLDLSRAGDEELEQFRERRTAVEQLAADYISLVAGWREALQESWLAGDGAVAPVH